MATSAARSLNATAGWLASSATAAAAAQRHCSARAAPWWPWEVLVIRVVSRVLPAAEDYDEGDLRDDDEEPTYRAGLVVMVAAGSSWWREPRFPIVLAGLLVLGMATIPLSVSLARRMECERDERQAAVRYGLPASDLERHELAQQLHDGVIQDLAGAGLLLDAIRLNDHQQPSPPAHVPLLDHAHHLIQQDVRRLRELATTRCSPRPTRPSTCGPPSTSSSHS